MSSVAELRQILKEDGSGRDLYGHLVETLMKILVDRPANAYDAFELISAEVKENPFDPSPTRGKPVPPAPDQLNAMNKWTNRNSTMLKVPDEPLDESEVKYPDLMTDAHLYEWAGISFGRGEIYRLYLSIKALAESLPAEVERLRFFGKISTRGSPYYIVEGLSPEDEEDIDEDKQESRSGANKYCYWITQRVDAGEGWVKLPNVTCAQIVTARQFKRFLTGDLNAPVPTYPPFPGVERNLLRATIALIASSTSISPDGFFEADDSDVPQAQPVDSETLAANFPKAAPELMTADAWKHHEIELNAIGRITAPPEKVDENGDVIEPGEAAEVGSVLSEIKPSDWGFRVCPGGAGVAAGSAVVARSLLWPGAVAIAAGSRFMNIYVGSGVRFSAEGYTPPFPQTIQQEFVPTEEDSLQLIEQVDVKVDPTPPQPEDEEEGEEED